MRKFEVNTTTLTRATIRVANQLPRFYFAMRWRFGFPICAAAALDCLVAFLVGAAAFPAWADGPPVAEKIPVTETFFGTQVTDPYRWMEDAKAPAFQRYMAQQAGWARQVLDGIAGREALERRIAALNDAGDSIRDMQFTGNLYFYLKRPRGAKNYALVMREGGGGIEKVLVDPDSLAAGSSHVSIDYFQPTRNGSLVAYALSSGGSERSTLHVLVTETGKDLPDRIDRTNFDMLNWNSDGRSFFYNRLAQMAPEQAITDRYKNSVVYLHVLGQNPALDQPVFGAGLNPAVAVSPTEIPMVIVTPDSTMALGMLGNGVQKELTAWVVPVSEIAGARTPWVKAVAPSDDVTWIAQRGDRLYLLTHHLASRFKVTEMNARLPDVAHAKTVVPESNRVVEDIAVAADALYVRDLDGGIGRVRRVPLDGGPTQDLQLPVDGAISGLVADPRTAGVLFSMESWVVSRAWYRFDPKTGTTRDTGILPRSAVDASAYTSEEIRIASTDGTAIPLSIVHKRDAQLDGSHPTLLSVYGAYGMTINPFYAPGYFALLERDGVWATCHARGGGEYGEAWHRAGQKLTKRNTTTDLIACATYLVEHGWTKPSRLAIDGASAGGIPVGLALTQRPDLFRVAIDEVGLSNALRSEFTGNGPPNVPEFGSVHTRDGFEALFGMDATQHVKPNVPYPAVLLTTGINDPRVPSFESAKMAARLQASTASGRPVLLRVDYDAGHGKGSTRAQQNGMLADKFAFMFWQFGLCCERSTQGH